MTKVKCLINDCIFYKDGCTKQEIELDNKTGCRMYETDFKVRHHTAGVFLIKKYDGDDVLVWQDAEGGHSIGRPSMVKRIKKEFEKAGIPITEKELKDY